MSPNGMCDYQLVILYCSLKEERKVWKSQQIQNSGSEPHAPWAGASLSPLPDHPAREEHDLEAKLHGAWFTSEAKREFYFLLCEKLEFFQTCC